jgi:manganese/iron transport system substrate-binding protein
MSKDKSKKSSCALPMVAITVAISLGACSQNVSQTDQSKPKVVATTSVICDMAKQIAADTIDLTCLIPPSSDPHVYRPTPGDRKNIEQAKLILYNGYNFEPSLIKLIQSPTTPTLKSHSFGVGQFAAKPVTAPLPKTIDEIDPHVWHDAEKGVLMIKAVRTALLNLAPKNAALYTKNAEAINAEIDKINAWIKAQVATIPQGARKLVTTHDALKYYSKAYGIPIEGALQGISTEEKPTAARVKTLVNSIKASKVPTIFAERTVNPKLIDAIAKEANVKVSDQKLYTDGLGDRGSSGETYQKMLVANTKAIVEGLGGTYTPFKSK